MLYKNKEVTLADIPGLIEGAHKGIGLGDKFLRHIERCKVLVHLVDLTGDNLLSNYKIRSELASYDKSLVKKGDNIFNKSDCMDKKTVDIKLRNFKFKNKSDYSVISTFNKVDLDKVKKILLKMLIKNSKKVVIKLGSSTVVDKNGKFKSSWIDSLIKDIRRYYKNHSIVIVSSGAIALGQSYLKIKQKKLKLT